MNQEYILINSSTQHYGIMQNVQTPPWTKTCCFHFKCDIICYKIGLKKGLFWLVNFFYFKISKEFDSWRCLCFWCCCPCVVVFSVFFRSCFLVCFLCACQFAALICWSVNLLLLIFICFVLFCFVAVAVAVAVLCFAMMCCVVMWPRYVVLCYALR